MKRIFSLSMLLCFLASSALAATSDEALKLLILGNQKYVLENSVEADLAATVIVDPAIETSPATLFGMPDSRLKVIKADSVVLDGRFTPVIIVLGTDEENVWGVYGEVLTQSPSLVQAVLKGETSVLGATVNAEDGVVSILGTHPDLMVMAGQYILGAPAQKSTPKADSSTKKTESTPEPASKKAESTSAAVKNVEMDSTKKADSSSKPASEKTESTPAKTKVAEIVADTKNAEQEAEPVAELQEAPASPNAPAIDEPKTGGGTTFLSVLLVVAGIIGVVILMDKTILKA